MSERETIGREKRKQELTLETIGQIQKFTPARFFNNFHLRIAFTNVLIAPPDRPADGKKIDCACLRNFQAVDANALEKRPNPPPNRGPHSMVMGWRRAKKTEREFLEDIADTAEKFGLLELIINCQIDNQLVNQQLRKLNNQKGVGSRNCLPSDLLNALVNLLELQQKTVHERFYTLAIPLYVELRLRGYSHHDLVV